jgi:hypothetical protein
VICCNVGFEPTATTTTPTTTTNVQCEVSEWVAISSCSVSCGGQGSLTRTRSITNRGNGQDCPSLFEIFECGTEPCATTTPTTTTTTEPLRVRYVRLSSSQQPSSSPQRLQASQLAVFTAHGVNIAHGRPCNTSTTNAETSCTIALDGNLQTRSYPDVYVGEGVAGEWMTVDLLEDYLVARVEYYNREDCCQHEILGATVELLDANWQPVAQYTIADTTSPQVFDYPPKPSICVGASMCFVSFLPAIILHNTVFCLFTLGDICFYSVFAYSAISLAHLWYMQPPQLRRLLYGHVRTRLREVGGCW